MTLALVSTEPTLAADLLGHLPIGVVVVTALVLLLTDAFARVRQAGFQRGLALLGVVVALALAARSVGDPDLDLGRFAAGGFLVDDHLTALADVLILFATAGVIGLAREQGPPASTASGFGEREPLILLACAGAMLVGHAGDLVTVWLGLELISLASLVLLLASHDAATTPRKRAMLVRQVIASLLGSALLAFGIAMVYAALGTTSLEGFARQVTRLFAQWGGTQRWVLLIERYGEEVAHTDPAMHRQAYAEILRGLAPAAMFLPAMLVVLVSLLAKLGLWPFARRRELDEDAPLHVAALRSTIVLVAVAVVILRVFVGGLHMPRMVNEPYGWTGPLPSLALVGGAIAVVIALRQRRLSRIVASLAGLQVALIVLGICVAANFHGHIGPGSRAIAPNHEVMWMRLVGDDAAAAVLLLLVTHVIAMVGCYAAMAAGRGHLGPEVRMQSWAGMAARRPWLAAGFSACLMSLVGLPPFAGFVGEFALLRAIAEHSGLRWVLVIVAIELSVAAFVVLKVIVAMYFGDETASEPGQRPNPGPWPGIVCGGAALLSVALGLGGQSLIEVVRLPAAGTSFEPGNDERLDWLEDRREAWALEDEPAVPDVDDAEAVEAEAETEGMSFEVAP